MTIPVKVLRSVKSSRDLRDGPLVFVLYICWKRNQTDVKSDVFRVLCTVLEYSEYGAQVLPVA
jgi:hypothetical protein